MGKAVEYVREGLNGVGAKITGKLKKVAKDAGTKRIVIKNGRDQEILAVPLTYGLAATTVAGIASPVASAVVGVAAVLSDITMEIERVQPTEQAAAA